MQSTAPSRSPLRKRVIAEGAILALVASGISSVAGLTGFAYRSRAATFWIVLLVEGAGILWILTRGRRRGNGFRRQLGEGTLAVVTMAAALFPATWASLVFVTPDYADLLLERHRLEATAAGVDEARIAEAQDFLGKQFVPWKQACFVVPGTLMTCFPIVLLGALFVRERAPDGQPTPLVEPET